MTITRNVLLLLVAVILFVLAAVFLIWVPSIAGTTDLALISLGLAAWAASGIASSTT